MIDLNDCYIASQVGIGVCTATQISDKIKLHVEKIMAAMSQKFSVMYVLNAANIAETLGGYLSYYDKDKSPDSYKFIKARMRLLMRRKRGIEADVDKMARHLARQYNRYILICGLILLLFILAAPFNKDKVIPLIDPYIFIVICALCMAPVTAHIVLVSQHYLNLRITKGILSFVIFRSVGYRVIWNRSFDKIASKSFPRKK